MADKLMRYYQYVLEEAGINGKVKLAQMTKIPSNKAAMEPDTPQTIKQFREAITQITGKPTPML
jgi:hypothetical protein